MTAYGQTWRASPSTDRGPDDHGLDGTPEGNELKLKRLRSVGRPMPDIEIGILGPQGDVLPSLGEGEICIRGERIMREYQGRAEETAEAIRGGWLHTGDVGYLDQDDYLFITGRQQDMIIRGRANIAPAAIEHVPEPPPPLAVAAPTGRRLTPGRGGERPAPGGVQGNWATTTQPETGRRRTEQAARPATLPPPITRQVMSTWLPPRPILSPPCSTPRTHTVAVRTTAHTAKSTKMAVMTTPIYSEAPDAKKNALKNKPMREWHFNHPE